MKAILIDPFTKTVAEIEHSGEYHDMLRTLQVDMLQGVPVDAKHTVYVDEEGLYKPDQRYFQGPFYRQPLAGRGLIFRITGMGDNAPPTLNFIPFALTISFPPVRFVDIITQEREGDVFGKPGTIIEQRAHFEPDPTQINPTAPTSDEPV